MRILPIVIIVLMLVPLVNAGEIIHTEITKEDSFVSLKERDALAFSFKDGDHRLFIRDINVDEGGVSLTVFTGVDQAQRDDDKNLPYYFSLRAGRDIANIDVDKDGENDVIIAILTAKEDGVLLSIKEYQINVVEDNDEVVDNGFDIKDFGLSSVIWTIILAIIAIFLLIFIIKKK